MNIRNYFIATGTAILGIALCIPAVMQAQQASTPSQNPQQGVEVPKPNQQAQMANRVAHPPTPKRQLKHLTRMLNLTADQQHQMLPILRHRRQQMEDIRNNASLSPEQRHQQVRALMQDTHQKLEGVMTDSQKQQFEQMQQQNRQRMRDRHMQRNGNAPPNSPPPGADGQNPPPPPPTGQNQPPQF